MNARIAVITVGLLLLSACTQSTPTPAPTTGSGAESGPEKLSYEEVLHLAENGDHDAEFELGAMYHDGDGVEQDYAKALQWYTKSAKAGNRQASYNLGLMYKNGEGTDMNLDAARGWFIRASDAGDVRAANALGSMSYTGQGVQKDFTKALQYFLKSARGGLADGQANTGVMYIRGEGVPAQNVVEGYAWLKLGMQGGSARASTMFAVLSEKVTEDMKKKGDDRAAELVKEMKAIKTK